MSKQIAAVSLYIPILFVHSNTRYLPTARLRADCLVETVVEGAKAEAQVARAIKAQEVFMICYFVCSG